MPIPEVCSKRISNMDAKTFSRAEYVSAMTKDYSVDVGATYKPIALA
jgi:hypothetical protein